MTPDMIEKIQNYCNILHDIRKDIMLKTIPSVATNPDAVHVSSAWAEQLSMDIIMFEVVLAHLRSN